MQTKPASRCHHLSFTDQCFVCVDESSVRQQSDKGKQQQQTKEPPERDEGSSHCTHLTVNVQRWPVMRCRATMRALSSLVCVCEALTTPLLHRLCRSSPVAVVGGNTGAKAKGRMVKTRF